MVDSWQAAESNVKMFKGIGLQKEKLISFNLYLLKVDKFSSTLRLSLSSYKCLVLSLPVNQPSCQRTVEN